MALGFFGLGLTVSCLPLIGGCNSWIRNEAARAASSNSGRSDPKPLNPRKPVAKGFTNAFGDGGGRVKFGLRGLGVRDFRFRLLLQCRLLGFGFRF